MNHGCLDMTANAPAAAKNRICGCSTAGKGFKAGVEQVLNVLNTVRAARVFST